MTPPAFPDRDERSLSHKTRLDLGWEALTEQLAARCHTARGVALARALAPLGTIDEARQRQQTVSEARALQDSGEPLGFGGISDIHPSLQRSEKGGVLLPGELCEIASTLHAGARLRRHLASRIGRAPRLAAHAERIAELPEVAGPISDAFDEHGALRDSASPALGGLRQRVNQLLGELTRRTDSLLNETHIAPHLQDRFVTQREDRYVVPVRADARTRIRGIVHGTSASGATVFVEPEEIIELNNKLKLAQLEVAEEERRILADLSQRVEQAVPRIVVNLAELAYLDLLDAAALLSTALRASPVTLQPVGPAAEGPDAPRLDLRNARHPLMLLAGTEVVPNDIVLPLGGTLIISGPNAGGKTVALKLTGLCALMARAGLHLPVQEGSTVPFFSCILTDVGDDQSLERNLSTFSAHVLNLRQFLQRSAAGTLILLDEIAVGTDPEQGAALAQALLEAMAQAQATVLITTHYDRLKALGASGARFANASVGYDLARLQPTYRLHLGIPGASSALPVAERLGLPTAIIGRAKELLVAGQSGAEQLMQALAAERERTLQLQAEARELHEHAQRQEQQATELLAQARLELGKARRKAHDEAIAALQAARRELGETKLALRAQAERLRAQAGEPSARDSDPEAQAEYQRAQRRLDQLSHEIAAAAPPRQGPIGRAPTADELVIGAKVYVPRLGAVGTIASDAVRDKVVVQVGALRLNADLGELLLPDAQGRVVVPRSASAPPKAVNVSLPAPVTPPRTPDATIDLRGERLPVAIARTEKFVDDALRESRSAVFVLHGHGTGILRQAIRSHFHDFPGVRSARPAEASDGGDGVTVLELES
jgi:DNA mismatch repair protein MutS2